MKKPTSPKLMCFPKPMNSRLFRSSRLLLPAVIFCGGSAFAATLTWDGGDATANSSYGGSGSWDSSTVNWTKAGTETNWTDTTGADTAVFAGTAGTATISGTNTVNGLIFGASVFTLTGGGLNLAGTSPSIDTGTGTITINSVLSDTASAGLTKTGSGILTLRGANTYTGITTVNLGTLTLDFSGASSPATNIINSASTLVLGGMGGATLAVNGKASAVNSQTFAGLTLNSGAATLSITDGDANNATKVALGAITRNVGSTVNFIQPTTNTIISASNGYTTTTANDSTGILGGWATVGGASWAANNGTNIVAYTAYTNDTWAASNNTTVTTNGTITSATTNSLRFNASGAKTLTLSGTNVIASGGILETSAVGGANLITITGGILKGSSNGDLIVNQFNTSGTMAIASTIADNGTATALTKSGSGTLNLTGSNTFTGGIFVNTGTLLLSASNAYTGGGDVNVVGGVFKTASNNAYSGASNLIVRSGTAALSATSSYTGTTAILGGQVNVGASSLSGVSGAFGNSGTDILLGNTSGAANATIKFVTGATIGRNITLQGGNTGTAMIGIGADLIFPKITGTITLGSNGIGHDLLLDVGNTAAVANTSLNISGLIQDPSGLVGQAGSVTFLGNNIGGVGTTLTLSGSNTFSGGFNLGRDASIYGASPSAYLAINNDYALGTGVFTINGGNINMLSTVVLRGISGMVWKSNFSVGASGLSGTSANLGTAPVTLANSSQRTTLTVLPYTSGSFNTGALTVGGVISGAGQGLDFAPSGIINYTTLALNGANTFDGGITMTSSTVAATTTLKIGNLGTSSGNSALGTGTFTIGSGPSATILKFDNSSGADGTLATNNAQVWNNSFQFLGTNSLNMGTGAVTLSNTTATITVTVGAKTLTIGGAIGNGSVGNAITKAGTGTLVLAGANTYNGDTTVSSGSLVLANLNALQNSTLASGTATFDSSVSSSGNFILGGIKGSTNLVLEDNSGTHRAVGLSVGNNNQDTTYSGAFSGAGSLTKIGTGNLTLNGTNTYTGATTVNNGTLTLNGVLNASSAVTVNNAALAGSGTASGTVSGSDATINGSGLSMGAATLRGGSTLSGNNTTSSVTIAGGTTTATGTTTASSGLTVSAGAALKLNGQLAGSATVESTAKLSGTGTITGAANIQGTLAAGNSIGTINTGDLTLGATSVLDVELGRNGAVATSDLTNVVGTVSIALGADLKLTQYTGLDTLLTGDIVFLIANDGTDAVDGFFGSLNGISTVLTEGSLFSWNSQMWEITYKADSATSSFSSINGNDVALMVVPEPSTWAMIVGGMGMLGFAQRLRRRQS